MNDLISRQTAIDALIEWYGCEPNDIDAFKEIIYNKPSAQPEIIRCGECKHRDKRYLCDVWGKYIYNGEYYCGSAERREE